MPFLLGVVVGSCVGFVLANALIQGGKAERYNEAYEKGWTHGYDTGINQSKPAKARARRVRKVEEA